MVDPEEAMNLSHSDSFLEEAASARGHVTNEDDDDEDLFYIPERRPSLDLGPSATDTSLWHEAPAPSPVQSYGSMTSGGSVRMDDEDESSTRVQLTRADSFSSCYSFDSDDCEKRTPKAKAEEDAFQMEHGVEEDMDKSETTDTSENTNEFRHPSLTVSFTFKLICDVLKELSPVELKLFKEKLWKRCPGSFFTSPQQSDLVGLVDRLLEHYSLEESLQITKDLLTQMKLLYKVHDFQKLCFRNAVSYDLRKFLKEKYSDSNIRGEKQPFDEIYTDLCISDSTDNGPNIEHEVMTIKKLSTNTEENKLITVMDIHAGNEANSYASSFVLLNGVAGSGKSTLVQRLILDWAEERSHQHLTFLFPFTFRELQQFQDVEVSLLTLIHELFPPARQLKFDDIDSSKSKVLLIFDGLDEYKGKVDFFRTELYGSFPQLTTLNVLVVNMLRGRLLSNGRILVTTRSQAQHHIPYDLQCREIQLQGFSDSQKDEYFRKRFKDAAQAGRVISHVKSLKTLHIMCHLPLFCSVVAEECQRVFTEKGSQAELPGSLTYMYTKLMLVMMRDQRSLKAPERSVEEERDFIMGVGKMAFTMLEQGTFLLEKAFDWKPHEVDDKEMVDYSGIGTEFHIKPQLLYRDKVISFIHPTMQEYMAALYAFLSFTNQGKNIFDPDLLKNKFKGLFKAHRPKVMELYKSALDRSLQHEDGKMDIFLRFLFGMLVETNLELLQPFCNMPLQWPTATSDAAAVINKRIADREHPNRIGNLQHCLQELGV